MTQLALILLLVPVAASAQSGSRADSAVFQTRGAFFALSVSDLDGSTRWYSEKLGLAVVMRPPKTNGAQVTVLEGGGLIVELIQDDAAKPLRQLAPSVSERHLVHGMTKAGVIVDDFERLVTALRARSVAIAYGPFPARPDQRANLIIRDNEGNMIQFFGR